MMAASGSSTGLQGDSQHLMYRKLYVSVWLDVNDIHVSTIEITVYVDSCGHLVVFAGAAPTLRVPVRKLPHRESKHTGKRRKRRS